MEFINRKNHWENIYRTKQIDEVSWYQPMPSVSLDLINELNLVPQSKIIDIGGGDSYLVDNLLEKGYQNISVLDISESAIEKAKQRLSDNAKKVNWIVTDVVKFYPTEEFDLWHDRAAFHFLTEEPEISAYIETAQKAIKQDRYLIIGTFSEHGPKKCSGIQIQQYSESSMKDRFKLYFELIKCVYVDHKTPFDTIQNFIFCTFRKR